MAVFSTSRTRRALFAPFSLGGACLAHPVMPGLHGRRRQLVTCPNCRAVNPQGARFCSNCGTALSVTRPLEGERRLVTVLFADVVGSTALAEQVDPEEWAELMNGAFAFMIAAVNRYEGTVGRLMGDAILALFGAPEAHEDDAVRAVMAALDMRDAAAEYGAIVKRKHGLDFAVRVGINTGLSVVTTVGDETKAEYTAMGDTANVAARLQGLARPQTIVIGPETYALVSHLFETKDASSEPLKGRAESVITYEVVGRRVAAGLGQSLAGVVSPFVGRASELGALTDLLAEADAGHGRLAFVIGEAGLGKSRLLAEAMARAGGKGLLLEATGVPYERTSPYYPWRQLLRAVAEPLGADPPGAIALLLDESDDPAAATSNVMDADTFASKLVREISRLLGLLARERTIVVAFEDFHWADPASIGLVEDVAVALQDSRVLFVCLARPEHHSDAWGLIERVSGAGISGLAERPVVLEVAALGRNESQELLTRMLDVEGMPDEVRSSIVSKADGNPFFLEEVLRSLIDSGSIANEGGTWRATSRIDQANVPNTLSGVLSARIDRLPHVTRDVLQTAAVIGREFASPVLSAVMRVNSPASDVLPYLEELSDEDLINHVPLAESDFRFKHELTRDAAYQRLLLRRRRELHACVARELDASSGKHLPEMAKLLAYHYLLGEQWLEGARHSVSAAGHAVRLYATAEALELYEAALAALDNLGGGLEPGAEATVEHKEVAIDAAVGWVNAAVTLRWHEDTMKRSAIIARGEAAVVTARTLDDDRRLVRSLVALGNVQVLSGFPAAGFGVLGEAHDVALRLGDEHLFLQPFWAATESMVDENPAGAVVQFDSVIALARKVGHKAIEAHALGTKAAALARLGDFAGALESGELALQAAVDSGSIIKLADVNALVGAVYIDMGLTDVGLEYARRGADLALRVNGFECACAAFHLVGRGELQARRLEEATANLRRSIEFGAGTAFEPMLHNVRIDMASARFVDRDVVAAAQTVEVELGKAEAVNDGFGGAKGRLVLAEALWRHGEAGRATQLVTASIRWFRERGMLPYLARALALLSRLEGALGNDGASEAAGREARELTDKLALTVAELGFAPPPPSGGNASTGRSPA